MSSKTQEPTTGKEHEPMTFEDGHPIWNPDGDEKRVCQLTNALTPEQHLVLKVLSEAPEPISAGAWIARTQFTNLVKVQFRTEEIMCVEKFVELRESMLAEGLVAKDQSGRYSATPLGRCVTLHLATNLYVDASRALEARGPHLYCEKCGYSEPVSLDTDEGKNQVR